MKIIHSTVAIVLSAIALVGTISACSSNSAKKEPETTKPMETQQTTEAQGISEIKISNLESTEKLKVGDTKLGVFSIKSKGDVDLSGVEVISSNSTVVSIDYKAEKLDTSLDDIACSFYIKGESSGEAIVSVKTKDGAVKSKEIAVTVYDASPAKKSSETADKEKRIKYTIEREENTSTGKTKRVSVLSTISEADYKSLSDSELVKLSERIVTEYCSSHKVCGMTSRLCIKEDEKEFGDIEYALPISVTNYWPYGDIEKANSVTPGDYSTFKFDVKLENKARDAYFKNTTN